MINPLSFLQPSIHQAEQPHAEPRPDPQAQTPPVAKSGALSQDQVTLRSAGQADTDHK